MAGLTPSRATASTITYDRRAILESDQPDLKDELEGTGVEPDFKVTAAEALEVAKKLAAKK